MIEQRSEQWFAQRQRRITASIVGAILGHNPWMTRADAMRLLVREALGAEREFKGNPATDWGNHHEAGAIIEFQMETGIGVEPAEFVPFEDWAGASPDGWTSDGAGIEQKCPYGLRNEESPVFKTLDEQPHYYDQVQFSIFVTGKPFWHFSQWAPKGTNRVIVERDQIWIDDNLPRLRQFHAEFLCELEESPDEHLAPKRLEIDTPEAHRMVAEWDELNDQLERAADRKKDLLESMVRLAGEKDALLAGRKLTLTERQGSVSYAKVVKEQLPKLDLELYRGKPSKFWGLR